VKWRQLPLAKTLLQAWTVSVLGKLLLFGKEFSLVYPQGLTFRRLEDTELISMALKPSLSPEQFCQSVNVTIQLEI
jgi:hypothetical protein